MLRFEYSARHDRLSALLWQERWMEWLKDGSLFWPGGMPGRQHRRQLAESFPILLAPMFGHNGQLVTGSSLVLTYIFGSDDSAEDAAAAQQFVTDKGRLNEVEWPAEKLVSNDWSPHTRR